jgi:hypothetical protein
MLISDKKWWEPGFNAINMENVRGIAKKLHEDARDLGKIARDLGFKNL